MKKPFRRLTALLMAALVTAGACPVFAADETGAPASDAPGMIEIEETDVYYSASFSFTIDPFQVKGREQVFSEPIRLVNENPFPVEVELMGLVATGNDADVRIVSRPVEPSLTNPSPDKKICLILRRADGADGELVLGQTPDGPVYVTLGASRGAGERRATIGASHPKRDYDALTLGGSGTVFRFDGPEALFEIVGTVNPTPAFPWIPGDVTVSAAFAANPIGPYAFAGGSVGPEDENFPELEEPEPLPDDVEEPEPEPELEEFPGPTLGISGKA